METVQDRALRIDRTPTAAESNGLSYGTDFDRFLAGDGRDALLFCGDALSVLEDLPADSCDCVMTSPPYWGHRDYGSGGIGLEDTWSEYVANVAAVGAQLKRVLKPTGSLWLNLGDAYHNKNLLGLPWRVAHALTDEQGWVLRNSVVWNKVKGGMDSATDKLRNHHELLFHFVKRPRGYYYDVDAARHPPRRATVAGARFVSATGVSGVRYRRQIERTPALSELEKTNARAALDRMLADVRAGTVPDFRMIIRGVQRVTHSDAEARSGRARELKDKGFYFLKYHPHGAKRGDVWDVVPEDTHQRTGHFAPYPEELCELPIRTTCPEGGIVLDPFVGTGTTSAVAVRLGRKAVGIDISPEHIQYARERCRLVP